jgi:hypothetical protein
MEALSIVVYAPNGRLAQVVLLEPRLRALLMRGQPLAGDVDRLELAHATPHVWRDTVRTHVGDAVEMRWRVAGTDEELRVPRVRLGSTTLALHLDFGRAPGLAELATRTSRSLRARCVARSAPRRPTTASGCTRRSPSRPQSSWRSAPKAAHALPATAAPTRCRAPRARSRARARTRTTNQSPRRPPRAHARGRCS